jgi:hypothetical protein
VLSVGPLVCAAQVSEPLLKGQRIRVVVPCQPDGDTRLACRQPGELRTRDGWVRSVENGVLRIQTPSYRTDLVVPLASLQRLDVARTSHGNWGTGAAIGTLLGGGIGLAAGLSSPDEFLGPGATAFLGTITGLAGGFVAGSILGLAIRTDDWTPVAIGGHRVSVAPRIDAHGIGLTIGFRNGAPRP